jgi:hypothetical protein
MAVLLLLHVPPTVEEVSVVLEPTGTDGVPPIAAGAVAPDCTVTVVVLLLPPHALDACKVTV